MDYIFLLLIFLAGVWLGRILFSDSKPRAPLAIHISRNGWDANEFTGLLASIIIQKTPWIIPKIVDQTDKTMIFKHPRPKYKIHYIFVPKKDIRNVGDFSLEDKEYIIDLFSTIVFMIKKLGISNYRVWTNGPEKQDVAYLHFHLGAD